MADRDGTRLASASGMPPIASLLIVLESHAARVLSKEEPDVLLMRSIARYVTRYLDCCRDLRDVARARAVANRLRHAIEQDAIDRTALELVASLRLAIATMDAELRPHDDGKRLRARFTELSREAGCDCEYE